MKKIYLLLLLCFVGIAANATNKVYTPNSFTSLAGGATYCPSATATALTLTYGSCSTGSGSSLGTALVTSWYSSTGSGVVTGGSFVASVSTTSNTATTGGTTTWAPPTTTPGTYYYYAVIRWTGTGTCNTTGSLTTTSTATVIVSTTASVTATAASKTSGCTPYSSTLSLTGASPSGLSYQWQSSPDGITFSPISGATTASYAATVNGATFYECSLGCASGSPILSPTVQVSANIASVSTTAASKTGGCTPYSSTLSLTGTSPTGLVYQWQSSPDGVTFSPISGATAATYAATVNAATFYECSLGCSAGTPVTSPTVAVTANITAGGTAAATTSSGCNPYSTTLSLTGATTGAVYQWQSSTDNVTFTPVTGATASTFAPNIVSSIYYDCAVSCASGTLASTSASVHLNGPTNTPTPGTLIFNESYESTWVNGCSTKDLPDLFWVNTPSTGNNSWRRNDDVTSGGWGLTADGAYTPGGSAGNYSSRFHVYDATNGQVGTMDLYIDLSPPGQKQISYDYIGFDNEPAGTYGTSAENLVVLISTNNGTSFTQLDAVPNTGTGTVVTAWTTRTVTTSATSSTSIIRFQATSDYGDYDLGLDNVKVTPLSPTLIVSPSTLNFGNIGVNTYSASQIFTLTGLVLTGYPSTVSLTVPANYQISTDNSTWNTTASVSYTAATLPATPIYVRFSPTASITYTGTVTASATGTNIASVTVTGAGAGPCTTPVDQPTAINFSGTTSTATTATLTDASPPVGGYLLIASNGAFTGTLVNNTSYIVSAVIGNGTVVGISSTPTVSVTGLTPNSAYTITVFPYSNSASCAGPVYNTVNPLTGTITTCLASPTSVTISNVVSGGFGLSWSASSGATSYLVAVSTNSGFTAPIAGSPFSVNGTSTAISGLLASTTYYCQVIAVGGSCNSAASATASVTTTGGTSITITSGFNYDVIANGANTVPGSTTIGTAGYDGGGWVYYSNDFYVANSGGTGYTGLPNSGSFTSAYTAGMPYQLASYSGNNCLWLPASTAGNTGTLTFANPVYASTLYILGNVGSGNSSCTAETVNLTITYTDNTTQTGSVSYGDWYSCTPIAIGTIGRVGQTTNFDGSSSGPNLYEKTLAIATADYAKPISSVKFTTTAGAGYLGILALSVRNGTLAASTGSLSFSGVTACSSSAAQIFSVSGTYLYPSGGSITVNAPAGFQVSNNGSTWGSTAAITYAANTMTNAPVYVQFDPTSGGNFSGNITFSGGTVNNPPIVPVSGVAGGLALAPTTTAAFGNVTELVSSAAQIYTLTGTGLTAGTVTIASSNPDFQVSPDNINWYASYNISNGTTIPASPVYINFTPSLIGAETSTITVTGGGIACGASINATGAGALSCTTPGAPTAISFPNTNSSGTGISFTPNGTPDGYMIVQGSSAFTGTATNTVTYSTGNSITNGTVVGNYGNTLPIAITSQTLAPINGNTNYWISVIPFNGGTFGTCGSGPLYAPAAYLQGNYTTCPVSAAATSSSITTTSFILSWPSSSGGSATTVTYKLEVAIDAAFLSPVSGYPQTVTDVPAGTVTQTINGLVSGTPYYYRITAIGACNSTATTGSATTTTASYCAPTAITYGCSSYYASSVTGQGLTFTAAGGCGAGNQLALIATVTPGVAATLTVVTQGYTGCTMWADLNSNGTFDNNELLDNDSFYNGGSPATYIANIGVSANTPPGNYRMRLITGWGTQGYFSSLPGSGSTNNGYGPCGAYAGETYEDFTLQVLPAASLTVFPTSVSFNNVQICSVSPTQSVTVTGGFLSPTSGSVTATAPAGFRVSNDGAAWGTTATLAYTGGTLSAPLYVDFNPGTTGATSGNIILSGGGASVSPSVSVSGTGTLPPTPQPISGTTNFCYSGTTINSSLGETLAGGAWSSSSPTVATVDNSGNLSVLAAGTTTITYSITTCSITSSVTALVTVNAIPVSVITPSGTVTACGSQTLTVTTGAGYQYQWYNSSGVVNGATNSTYVLNNSGSVSVTNTYSVQVTNTFTTCNSISAAVTVILNPVPTASVTPAGPVSACGSELLTAVTNIGDVYQWYNSSGIITGATNNTYNAVNTGSVSATNTYSVQVTNSLSNCNSTSSGAPVTLYAIPTASVSPSGTVTACGSQTLTAVTNIGNQYQWYNGSGVIAGATNNSYVANNTSSVSATNSYSVVVTNSVTNCNSTSAATTVTLSPVPTATITTPGGVTSACGSPIVVTGNTNIGDTYQWSNSSGTISGATNSTYTATITGTYSVNIEQSSTGCNLNTATTVININAIPTASVSPTGTVTACGTQTLTAGTNIGNAYQWYNTSGIITGATGSTYVVANTGSVITTNTYSVVVTNSLTNCNSTSAGTTVTLDPVPTATITTPGNITANCADIVMTANTNIGDAYQWSNSSGIITGATNTTYTATVSSTYSVNIKKSSTGCNISSAGLVISIVPPPSASVSPSGIVTTCGSQVLTAVTDFGNAYQWYNSSGIINGATNSIYTAVNTGTVSATNSYSVAITNTVTNCGNTSAATTVTLYPVPTASVSPTGTVSACGTQTLTASTNIGNAYQWYSTSGIIGGATNSTYILNNTGSTSVTNTYSVQVTNTSTNCNIMSAGTTVILNAIPTASVSPTGTVTACGSQLLTAGTNIGNLYQWYNSAGIINGATNNTYTVNNIGSVTTTNVYSVTVTNSATNCNLTSAGTTVKLNPLPTASISPTGTVTNCGSQVLTAGTNIGNVYQWYNSSGAISGATNSTYAAINSGSVLVTNTYSVVVTNSVTNCNSTSTGTTVMLNPGPTSIISPSGTVTACGSELLTALTNIGNAYQWYSSTSGAIIGATNSSYTANNTGSVSVTNTYSVVVTNTSTTCNNTSPGTTVILNPIPTASVTPGGTVTACGSQALTAGTNIGNRYQWYNGSGIINGATNNTYTANNTGSTVTTNVYSVMVTNSTTGCNSTSAATTVILNAIPTSSVSPAGTVTACGSELLTAGTNIGNVYQWYSSTSGAIGGATNNTYTVNNTGSVSVTAIYSVMVTNGGTGCNLTSAGTTVIVNPIPTSSVSPTGTVTACGSQVLTAGTNIGNRYQWYNGSGTIAGATNNTYTANNNGSVATTDVYSVTVTSSTTGCNSTSAATTVILNAIPTSTFTTAGGITTNCGSLLLTGSSNIGDAYQWYKSTGIINGATNAAYTATVSGTYYIKATNTGTGCNSNSATQVITINPYPVVTVTPNGPTTFCAGSSITLTASNGYSYQWQNYGVNIGGATNNSYTSSQSGIFRVILSTTAPCIDTTATTTITVNPLPSDVITANGPLAFCSGGSVVLSAQTGLASYQWVKPVNAIVGANANSYTATTSGSYRVVMTTASNCRDTSIVMVVDVLPLPSNTVTVSGATTFCEGGSVTLTGPSGMASYQWHDSTSAIPGAAGQGYTTGASGSYKVFVSNGQCSDSSAAEVITNASPDTSLAITGSYSVVSGILTICAGNTLNLSTGAGASSYQWDSSTVTILGANTQTYTVTESGVYTLIMNSSFGCTDSVSRNITVDTLPVPAIYEYGYGLQTTQSYTSYQWYLNGAAIPGATNRGYLATTDGPYTVMVTDANGCSGMSVSITLNSLNVGTVTGIDISLYPNPASSVVYIQSPVKVKAVVYTIEGQEVGSKEDAKQIDLSRLANGTYMVKLFGDDGTLLKVSKLVKSE